jgi:hypothetical protein
MLARTALIGVAPKRGARLTSRLRQRVQSTNGWKDDRYLRIAAGDRSRR